MRPSLDLLPAERILWQGRQQTVICFAGLKLLVQLAVLLIVGTGVNLIAPDHLGAICVGLAVLAGLCLMRGLNTRPKSYTLTDQRIVEFNSIGAITWRDGAFLSGTQNAETRSSLCGKSILVRTVQMDHGDPTEILVGPIPQEEAEQLAVLLKTVKSSPGFNGW